MSNMKLTEQEARKVNAEIRYCRKDRDLFENDAMFLMRITTMYRGAYPDWLERTIDQINEVCADVEAQVDDRVRSLKNAPLSQEIWDVIFRVTDGNDLEDDISTKEAIRNGIDALMQQLSDGELRTYWNRLHEARYGETMNAAMLEAMNRDELIGEIRCMQECYMQEHVFDDLLATQRAARQIFASETQEKKEARQELVRAATARLAGMPKYQEMLKSGEMSMEALALMACAAVESKQIRPEDEAEEISYGDAFNNFVTAACELYFAWLFHAICVGLIAMSAGFLPVVGTGVLAIMFGVAAILYICDAFNDLCPNGIGATRLGIAAHRTCGRVLTGAGNLARDAVSAVCGKGPAEHKVMVAAPRRAVVPAR